MRPPPFILATLTLVACTGSALTPRPFDGEITAIGDVQVEPDTTASEIDSTVVDGGLCGEALRVESLRPEPGGGVSIVVQLAAPDGSPGRIEGATALLDGMPASIAALPPAPGITALVIAGDSADARRFVDAMPAGERFVVWNGAELIVDATIDRARVVARIAAAAPAPAPDYAAWLAIGTALAHLGGEAETANKALVIGTTPPPMTLRFETYTLDGTDVAAHLLARRAGLARVGACPSGGARVAELTVSGVTCAVTLPAAPDYLAGLPCDASADWSLGDRVDIRLTPDEAATWQARHAARSQDEFSGALAIGGATPQRAQLHFRGQTSLDCERKSYNIDLDGSAPRPLMPGVSSDKLYLISMCADEGYYNQLLADRLAQYVGVFPLQFRVVVLYVNDVNQGLYLMMEDPIQGLRDDHVALTEVVRRRLDQDGNAPEVKYTADHDDPAALARYLALLDVAADPVALGQRLDLDAYLRWIALEILLENGDYIDEIFFFASAEGEAAPHYHVMAWDPDDLWSACHRNGRDALPDPHGILYCVEADIDHVLFANPDIYDRFITHLEDLLATLPIERIVSELASARDELFSAVHDDATAAAMTELTAVTPSAATVDGFRSAVQALMDRDLQRAATWIDMLRERVATYRGAQ